MHARIVVLLFVVSAVLAIAAKGGPVRAQDPSGLEQFALLAGDSIVVRFPEPFCVSRLFEGEPIHAEVAADKVASSRVLIAEGARVEVEVVEKKKNGRGGLRPA